MSISCKGLRVVRRYKKTALAKIRLSLDFDFDFDFDSALLFFVDCRFASASLRPASSTNLSTFRFFFGFLFRISSYSELVHQHRTHVIGLTLARVNDPNQMWARPMVEGPGYRHAPTADCGLRTGAVPSCRQLVGPNFLVASYITT